MFLHVRIISTALSAHAIPCSFTDFVHLPAVWMQCPPPRPPPHGFRESLPIPVRQVFAGLPFVFPTAEVQRTGAAY